MFLLGGIVIVKEAGMLPILSSPMTIILATGVGNLPREIAFTEVLVFYLGLWCGLAPRIPLFQNKNLGNVSMAARV